MTDELVRVGQTIPFREFLANPDVHPELVPLAMSTQIAVRLPDAVVEFIDARVKAGETRSRAAFVTSALEREMRRLLAENDARILAALPQDGDLDSLTQWAADYPIELH